MRSGHENKFNQGGATLPQCNTDMFYKFIIETLQLTEGSSHHTIIKYAVNAESAIVQIANEAQKLGFSITNIEYCGQYNEMPPNCRNTFRGKKSGFISIRVLQHDKGSDQIRIGAERGIFEDQMDRLVQDTIAQYEQRTEWCGGFQVACERYYKRIAIVEADSLAVLRVIYPVKEEEE